MGVWWHMCQWHGWNWVVGVSFLLDYKICSFGKEIARQSY